MPAWPNFIEDAWLRDVQGLTGCADNGCAGIIQDCFRYVEGTSCTGFVLGWSSYVEGAIARYVKSWSKDDR